MNVQEIKEKYLGDDAVSKTMNERFHNAKAEGNKFFNKKINRDNAVLREYIRNVNKQLPRQIEVFEKNRFEKEIPTFGINWSAIGTVSVPEAKLFAQKILKACEMIQNAPKSGAKQQY